MKIGGKLSLWVLQDTLHIYQIVKCILWLSFLVQRNNFLRMISIKIQKGWNMITKKKTWYGFLLLYLAWSGIWTFRYRQDSFYRGRPSGMLMVSCKKGTEGRFSPVTTPGTHVVNDHMFILQGYEGSLLKVTNKNGKNTSVSTLHGPHALQNILSPPHSRCEGCDRVWSLGIGLYQSTLNEGVTRIQFCLCRHVVQLILFDESYLFR